MSAAERQRQFEDAVVARPGMLPGAACRIARNFGFSNSARVIEGGLFACTNNLQSYSEKLAAGSSPPLQQFVFLCVLTFPPQDEVYFAVVVTQDAARVNAGLLKLYEEGVRRNVEAAASGTKPNSISNNVKFYIKQGGQLYFHNFDFLESLDPGVGEAPLDPDCMVRIDSILFGIWPAAASARRSLLAREFVGYLGRLVGRDHVHELKVWEDPRSVGPAMRRMPSTLALPDIEASVAALGGHYPAGQVGRLHAGLNFLGHKHFVILSGLSGTGKTQLALKYARAVHGMGRDESDPLLFVCPVRPEWTDPTGLTGYLDVLTGLYVVPPFLESMLLATAHRESPVFVILDEMNLARVEYYLSDALSAMETGEALQLHSSGVPLEGSSGMTVPAELPMPRNLFLVGTINVDETTNAVSDKVLDRAIVIDMSEVDLAGFLTKLADGHPGLAPSCAACTDILTSTHAALTTHGLGFGYRVADEFIRYHAFCVEKTGTPHAAIVDQLMVQKVLVKLRGGERQRPMLAALRALLKDLPRAASVLARLQADLDEFGSFQAAR